MIDITCENIEQYPDILYKIYSYQFDDRYSTRTSAIKRCLGIILPFLSVNLQPTKTLLSVKVMSGKSMDILVLKGKEEFWVNASLLSRLWFKYKDRLLYRDKQRYYQGLMKLFSCQALDNISRYSDFTLEERCDLLATYTGSSILHKYIIYYTDTEAYCDTPIGIIKLKFAPKDLVEEQVIVARNGDLVIVAEGSLIWASVIRDGKVLTQISETTQVTGIVPSDDKATRRKMLFCKCGKFSYSDIT